MKGQLIHGPITVQNGTTPSRRGLFNGQVRSAEHSYFFRERFSLTSKMVRCLAGGNVTSVVLFHLVTLLHIINNERVKRKIHTVDRFKCIFIKNN